MSNLFLKYIIKYIHYIPTNIFKFSKSSFTKVITLFNTIQYKSDYKGDNLIIFIFPLIINIFQISYDIKNLISNKELVCIVSTISFYEKNSNNEYTHTLTGSDKLYSLNDLNNWSSIILFSLIEKLELYNSFDKISLTINVRIITSL